MLSSGCRLVWVDSVISFPAKQGRYYETAGRGSKINIRFPRNAGKATRCLLMRPSLIETNPFLLWRWCTRELVEHIKDGPKLTVVFLLKFHQSI